MCIEVEDRYLFKVIWGWKGYDLIGVGIISCVVVRENRVGSLGGSRGYMGICCYNLG